MSHVGPERRLQRDINTSGIGGKRKCLAVAQSALIAQTGIEGRGVRPELQDDAADSAFPQPPMQVATKHIRLAFWPVQREEIPFVRADLVSRDTLEHLADFFWSETLNNVKPAA
jgi:hypothetical protein